MSEQQIIGIDTEHEMDQVQIADDVIAVIAEIATLEVEGMVDTAQSKTDFVQAAISRKKAPKGVKVEVAQGEVFIDIAAIVKYGVKINKVCLEAQEKVKNSVETMTGLHVASVNIHVVGVTFDKEQKEA
ncbi:Asp23/Gls24 family envelope stress response protein [Sporanaerobium hydrogeniformans]|uniref:Asp23/Gls24 family envelope stress response protein n=1 Tax=Sporanaerobium hydrogeniformans TaxID=3072179 RepID=A0AC61DLQ0_9FIRM|nr:Asp23/Gls24 family envelope stress response protein [Sporanaerobium hydrogeniformans]PHV72362.1 Asp23/Gls24 family envelope stress response protein [Sporanaerobium hydrogeniformans]